MRVLNNTSSDDYGRPSPLIIEIISKEGGAAVAASPGTWVLGYLALGTWHLTGLFIGHNEWPCFVPLRAAHIAYDKCSPSPAIYPHCTGLGNYCTAYSKQHFTKTTCFLIMNHVFYQIK